MLSDSAKDKLFDKGIDVLVVIFSILVALSIDSYRDTQKSYRQWQVFADQLKRQIIEDGKANQQIIEFYKQSVANAQKELEKIEGDKSAKISEELLKSMGQIQISFPESSLYNALISAGNETLVSNSKLLAKMSPYFNFEIMARSNGEVFSDHFAPDYKQLLRDYYSQKQRGSTFRREYIFMVHMYLRLSKQNLKACQENEELRKEILGLL